MALSSERVNKGWGWWDSPHLHTCRGDGVSQAQRGRLGLWSFGGRWEEGLEGRRPVGLR